MKYPLDGHEVDRVATFDIETTHYKPRLGETVSIGIGVHEVGEPADTVDYTLLHRDDAGEATLIQQGIEALDQTDAELLISYNGQDFDLNFLQERMELLDEEFKLPDLHTPDTHVDSITYRKAEASRQGVKYPSLEECLDAYDIPCPKTIWNGQPVTNTRFGEELGPAFLKSLEVGEVELQQELINIIDHYLTTDLEANLALYYADVNQPYTPSKLNATGNFST